MGGRELIKGLLEKVLRKSTVGDAETLGLNRLERKTQATLKRLRKILRKYESRPKNKRLIKGLLAKVLKR